ncbi:hypothetical protein PoB_000091000 [Plakobranchus ocellatus]|uniref:Uncharacterized protein n=1 Tax=Plakobranchus ocellatus TaxID=259542 RepID=A0AAV3XU82_9GAST|nr:hypothetical protein PoB_000091000 [Plakobranchus ocellatus]
MQSKLKKHFSTQTLYHKIHKAISHSRPIERHEINSIQQNIDEYMKFYRNNANHNIFPKLHFLEHHCTQWIDRWGFGMGMHGEQGVELVHSSIKKLEHQTLGMWRAEDKLKVMMKSHLTQVCPTLHYLLPSAVKRGNKVTVGLQKWPTSFYYLYKASLSSRLTQAYGKKLTNIKLIELNS